MSGPHALHRTPNRPVFEDMELPNPEFTEDGDEPETITIQVPVMHPTKTRLVPMPYSVVDEETGETVIKYRSVEIAAPLHVLDYRPQPAVVSKHAKGRTPKLSADRKRRLENKQARLIQARKTLTSTHRKDREALERALNA